ncbi:MAG: hypothetical protein AAFV59_14305, partial [Pseudomonadota bacterium]
MRTDAERSARGSFAMTMLTRRCRSQRLSGGGITHDFYQPTTGGGGSGMTYRRDKEREIARGKEQADWYREHLEGSTELTDEDYGWLGVWDFASIDAVLEDVHPADQFEAERMMVSASYKLVNMVYRLLARIE